MNPGNGTKKMWRFMVVVSWLMGFPTGSQACRCFSESVEDSWKKSNTVAHVRLGLEITPDEAQADPNSNAPRYWKGEIIELYKGPCGLFSHNGHTTIRTNQKDVVVETGGNSALCGVDLIESTLYLLMGYASIQNVDAFDGYEYLILAVSTCTIQKEWELVTTDEMETLHSLSEKHTDDCPTVDNSISCQTCPGGYFDGCNDCMCTDSGELAGCTKRACPPTNTIPPRCNLEPPPPQCCDPLEQPFCKEGVQCCPNDGQWSCSIGDGKTFPCGGELITDGFGKSCDDDREAVVLCTTDVQECPDGSFVSRNPELGCEFDPCPTTMVVDCTTCPNGFFDGCNQCGCEDGSDIPFCTLKFCPPDQITEPLCNPICPVFVCAAPPDGCYYGPSDATDEYGCPTSCGVLVCRCPPLPPCAAPPPGCNYDPPPPDENGCIIGCGVLKCECPLFKCPGPAEGCNYVPPALDENGCALDCGLIQCDACPTDVKKCPDGSKVERDPLNNCEFKPCKEKEQPKCCDPNDRPGSGPDSPGCRGEGFRCCPDGQWSCSIGDGKTFPCGGELLTTGFGKPCKVCPKDVKKCPGPENTTVSRDPQNDCQFVECPPNVCTNDVKTCPDGSFVGRDAKLDCAFPPCPPLDCQTCPYGYTDGCNTCACQEGSRRPLCTLRACGPNDLEEPRCFPAPVVCTADVKICYDGSATGRDPNNDCEFFPCPPPSCQTCLYGFDDGCNQCECDSKNSDPICTEKACLVQGEPKCYPEPQKDPPIKCNKGGKCHLPENDCSELKGCYLLDLTLNESIATVNLQGDTKYDLVDGKVRYTLWCDVEGPIDRFTFYYPNGRKKHHRENNDPPYYMGGKHGKTVRPVPFLGKGCGRKYVTVEGRKRRTICFKETLELVAIC